MLERFAPSWWRSRYAEDQLAEAVEQDVAQYVVLGAGLDTFACRNPHSTNLRVFEVDHPATQAWKLERLQAAGIAIPQSLKFARSIFKRQTLAAGLEQGGFDSGSPAFFSWLGVTPYLTRESWRLCVSSRNCLPAAAWPSTSLWTPNYSTCGSGLRCTRYPGGRLRASLSGYSSVPLNWPGDSGTWDFNAPKYWERKK